MTDSPGATSLDAALRRGRHELERERFQVGPNDASWPVHSGGNTVSYKRLLKLAQLLLARAFRCWEYCQLYKAAEVVPTSGPTWHLSHLDRGVEHREGRRRPRGVGLERAYAWAIKSFSCPPVCVVNNQ